MLQAVGTIAPVSFKSISRTAIEFTTVHKCLGDAPIVKDQEFLFVCLFVCLFIITLPISPF